MFGCSPLSIARMKASPLALVALGFATGTAASIALAASTLMSVSNAMCSASSRRPLASSQRRIAPMRAFWSGVDAAGSAASGAAAGAAAVLVTVDSSLALVEAFVGASGVVAVDIALPPVGLV